jgi:glycosyltransferase involved in cell wall biosynthesis
MTKISVVTPSYNQADYLLFNLTSVASSPNDVEHIVLDGGSTDGTKEILSAFDKHLAHWVSESDAGQYDAIDRGLKLSTGDVMAWLNSDDMYFPWTIPTVLEIFDKHPEIEWLTTRFPTAIDEVGRMIKMNHAYGFDRTTFMAGLNLAGGGWESHHYIQQESTFWRRSLWDRAGGFVDASYRYAGDFDLWARFFQHARLYAVDVPLGTFRRHGDQKTSLAFASYLDEAKTCLLRHGGTVLDPEVAAMRVAARRDPVLKQCLILEGLADWAPVLTYDWANRVWLVDEN